MGMDILDFETIVDSDGNVCIEPTVLKLQTLNVKTTKRGMYKADPLLVPEVLKDDNILWINEPIKVTAITESGKEIDVVLTNIDNQLNMEHRTIHPDDKEQTNV